MAAISRFTRLLRIKGCRLSRFKPGRARTTTRTGASFEEVSACAGIAHGMSQVSATATTRVDDRTSEGRDRRMRTLRLAQQCTCLAPRHVHRALPRALVEEERQSCIDRNPK